QTLVGSYFFFQAEDGIRAFHVTGVQTCALPISTGWATGPHLHYEFRIDNRPVNPLAADLPVSRPLEAAEAAKFKTAVLPYKQQIALLKEFQQTLPEGATNVASR